MSYTENKPNPRPVYWGIFYAGVLLIGFSVLNYCGCSPVINLPVQWLWVSLVPILLGLVFGGYIKTLEAGSVKLEMPSLTFYPKNDKETPNLSKGTLLEVDPSLETAYTDKIGYMRTETWSREGHNLFLVHVIRPSKGRGMAFDVSIYLMRHIWGEAPNRKMHFEDVEKAEFYFGENWSRKKIEIINNGGYIGVNASAWGQFLAVCRVTFTAKAGEEPKTVILHRYIDFEMAPRS